MSISKLVLHDLSRAVEADRARAFEEGILFEREQAFKSRQEAYERGVADAEARIIKLLKDKRCVCLDLTGSELRNLIDSDTPMKHANCDYVGLDWVIALIKGEK